ncbi:hypothetical protein GQR36_26135 [Enterococcus termitis]
MIFIIVYMDKITAGNLEKNTELAGTIGQKKKLEAIEVKLVEKPIPVTSISLNSSKNKIDMKIEKVKFS